MPKALKDTLKTIEHYKSMSPHYGELLDILEEILILREEYSRKMSKDVFCVDDSLVEKKLAGGFPIIDLSRINFDLSEPKSYFIDLLEIAKKRTPEEAREIIDRLDTGNLDFAELVRTNFTSDQPESEEEAEDESDVHIFDLLGFLIEESLRPYLEAVSSRYADAIARARWSEGYCPVCGREPKIGQLKDEEGRRFLFCSQCGLKWNFNRIKCPFCGNEDQQTLAYFSIEGEEKYRVDVCNKCRRYVKIVDFRELKEEPNLDVEDIATLHLDILADEEGYE